MKRIILKEIKGEMFYTVETPVRIFGVTVFWKQDYIENDLGYGCIRYAAAFNTLKEAGKYIKSCHRKRISKIK